MTTEPRSSTGNTGGGKATWVRVRTLVVATLLLSGCVPISMTVGVREPNLAGIQPGDRRSQVQRMLGGPVWQPGSADGVTYDIYEYEPGRPANPIFGTATLLADVYTFGMLELLYRDAQKFAPVKQVAVGYDHENRVRFVSQPWLISGGTFKPCRPMRSQLPADSGIPFSARPFPMDWQVGAASEFAILELDVDIDDVAIDGGKVEERVVQLPPGRHTVSYRTVLGGSVMYGAMLLSYDQTAEVDLLPGRHYRFAHKRFYGYPRSRADVFWIEDVESGETIYCASPTPD